MQIKKEMADEYMKWKAEMQKTKQDTTLLCFDYLCEVSEKGMNIISAISSILKAEFRPGSMSDEEVYLVMRAFSIFHKNGDDFRKSWNTVVVGVAYADYIEECNKKHLFPLFTHHSISDNNDGHGKVE